jgi:ZIP family zinc transporter
MDASLGVSAGVMLAATLFGLILPAIKTGGVWKTAFGVLLGAGFIILSERFVPHIHQVTGIKGPATHLKRIWLFIFAITIHNFPEGLSVGVGFGQGNIKAGILLAVGIGIQNIFEGICVAFPLLRNNVSRLRSFLIASGTAFVEPIGGFLGISVVTAASGFLPYGLAFAAGAMLFVIVNEMIPETHARGYAREATVGIIIGFVTMMILENISLF